VPDITDREAVSDTESEDGRQVKAYSDGRVIPVLASRPALPRLPARKQALSPRHPAQFVAAVDGYAANLRRIYDEWALEAADELAAVPEEERDDLLAALLLLLALRLKTAGRAGLEAAFEMGLGDGVPDAEAMAALEDAIASNDAYIDNSLIPDARARFVRDSSMIGFEWSPGIIAGALGAQQLGHRGAQLPLAVVLARAVAAGTTPSPDDDVQRDRFDQGRDALAAAGYEHYEVSNFARGPRARSRHNVLYWRHGDYLGVGVGAHAHRDGRRWWTTRSTTRYLEALEAAQDGTSARDELGRVRDVTEEEVLGTEERALERLMLGLRLAEGLHPFDVPPLAREVLEDAVREGLVTMSCGRLQATESGWYLIDETVRRLTA
jgi:hypothetical protein